MLFAVAAALAVSACARQQQTYYVIDPNTGQPVPLFNARGQHVGFTMSDLDEGLLKDVATATGGQYFRAADTATLKKTYDQIDKLEKHEIETVKYEEWTELFHWFLAPGMGCLLLAVLLENTRLRRLP